MWATRVLRPHRTHYWITSSHPSPPPEVNLANYLILNYDPLRRSDSVVLARLRRERSQRMPQVSYMNSMLRRIFVAALPLMAVGLASTARAQGNPPATTSAALFQNVRIFDGKAPHCPHRPMF
jgi:hypothetical protein